MRFTRGRVRELKNGHNSVTVQNRTNVYMNFFDHKDLGNHLLQLRPKVVKHPVYICRQDSSPLQSLTEISIRHCLSWQNILKTGAQLCWGKHLYRQYTWFVNLWNNNVVIPINKFLKTLRPIKRYTRDFAGLKLHHKEHLLNGSTRHNHTNQNNKGKWTT